MRVGFTRLDGQFHACVTVTEDTFAEFASFIAEEGDGGEKALDLFAQAPPETEIEAVEALDALIGIDSEVGTICSALEWAFGRVYAMAFASGRLEAMADLDAVAQRVRDGLTSPRT